MSYFQAAERSSSFPQENNNFRETETQKKALILPASVLKLTSGQTMFNLVSMAWAVGCPDGSEGLEPARLTTDFFPSWPASANYGENNV